MTIKFTEQRDVSNKTDTSFQNLMDVNENSLKLISDLEAKLSKVEDELRKSQLNSLFLDTTILETKVLELDAANEKVSTMELHICNLVDSLKEKDKIISSLNTDMRLSKEKITIYESKCERLENDISKLKAEKKELSGKAIASPGCQAENVSNDRIKTLESSNSKLREIIKKFTNSQTSFNDLVGNLSNNANRHGLGYVQKVQPLKPKKTNTRKFARSTPLPSSYCDDDASYVKAHKNSLCFHCNHHGHVSFDCYAFYNPKRFMWAVKKSSNSCGSDKRLPIGASLFAGASSSSN